MTRSLIPDGDISALAHELAVALGGGRAEITSIKPMAGGAVQENWRLDILIDGVSLPLVLRIDPASALPMSLAKAEEFAILKAVHKAGVSVPKAHALNGADSVLEKPYFVMQRIEGTAIGSLIVEDLGICPDRERLVRRLGRELATLHRMTPQMPELAFLSAPEAQPAQVLINQLRLYLDGLGQCRPALEWGLRWAELHAPATQEITLTHQDFRSGNLLLGAHDLAAVLDWEFAGWGDPMADLGWLCAACWRYSRPDLEAGGLGSRAALYQGYEAHGGKVDHRSVLYWEVMAHLRWAVIALFQAQRHRRGGQRSLDLAMTARIQPQLETTILAMTRPDRWRAM